MSAPEEAQAIEATGADAGAVPARLIIRTGKAAGTDVGIGDELRLGASPDNQLRLPIPGVSRDHARIWKDGEIFWLEDVGSTNGTFVNGQRVQRMRLRHLDVVTLARNVDLIFLQRDKEVRPGRGRAVRSASLEWVDGPEAGTSVAIPLGEITVGRDGACSVQVDVGAVSKVHARITRHADYVTIQDLGSTNGTTVNGRRLESVRSLDGQDDVTLGESVSFKVTIHRDPAAGVVSQAAFDTIEPEVFDQEWRTRLIWSADELADIQEARAKLRTDEMPPAPEIPSTRRTERVDQEELEAKLAEAEAVEATVAEPPAEKAIAVPSVERTTVEPPVEDEAEKTRVPTGDAGQPVVPDQVLAAAEGAKAPEAEGAAVGEETQVAEEPDAALPGAVADAAAAARDAEAIGAEAGEETQGAEGPDAAVPDAVADAAAVARAAEPEEAAETEAAAEESPPAEEPVAAGEAKETEITGIRLVGERGAHQLNLGRFVVGRGLEADVWLDAESVSRRHAAIEVSAGEVWVQDLDSANGTKVNGIRITEKVRVDDDDSVTFGKATLHLEFVSR